MLERAAGAAAADRLDEARSLRSLGLSPRPAPRRSGGSGPARTAGPPRKPLCSAARIMRHYANRLWVTSLAKASLAPQTCPRRCFDISEAYVNFPPARGLSCPLQTRPDAPVRPLEGAPPGKRRPRLTPPPPTKDPVFDRRTSIEGDIFGGCRLSSIPVPRARKAPEPAKSNLFAFCPS